MDNKDFTNLGEQIKSTVQEAVDTMKFDQLNADITNSVKSALNDVKKELKNNWTGYQDPNKWVENRQRYQNNIDQNKNHKDYHNKYTDQQRQNWQNQRPNQSRPYNGYSRTYGGRENIKYNNNRNLPALPFNPNPPGKVAGVLLQVFGYMGSITFGLGILVLNIVQSATNFGILGNISMGLLPLFLIGLLMIARGNSLKKRIKRFNRYKVQFRNQSYCTIKQLASNIGKSEKFVLKDVKKMIELGMFTEGHIDEQNTCLMVTNETYQQYLNTQLEYKRRQQESIENKKELDKNENNKSKDVLNKEEKNPQNEELRKTMEEGKTYIKQIREANNAIDGEEISNKLDRLEAVISKIFLCVEQYPEQLPELRKFMNYYLPTTLKLVNAYQEFDAQPIQGDNITSAKEEIRKTLDTINYAFEKLLDSLYEDAAMEVSTDISVLETLLAQEGLTEKDFKMAKGGNNCE